MVTERMSCKRSESEFSHLQQRRNGTCTISDTCTQAVYKPFAVYKH